MQGWNGRQAGGSLPSGSFGPSNHPVKGAGSQLPRKPKRVEGRWSRPMTQYGVTPNPNPGFCPVFATPHHLHSQSQQLGPAVDIGLASLRLDRLIDCLVPALGACFIQQSPKPTTTRRELVSLMSPSLAADPSPSLLALSLRKVSGLRYLQAVIDSPPRRPGNDPRHSTPTPGPG